MRSSARIDGGIVLIWAVAFVLAAGCFGQTRLMTLVTNRDALQPASFTWELLHHPYSWRGFEWPRVPSLFPDLLIQGAMQAVSGSWRMATLGYAMVSVAALATFAGLIAERLANVTLAAGAMAFLAVSALMIGAEWALDSYPWHLHLLAPADHSGTFVLSVACLLLAPRGPAPAISRLVMLAVLAALGTFSDKLFLALFLVPLLAAGMMSWRSGDLGRVALLRLAGVALLGCAAGWLADKAIFPQFLSRQPDEWLAPDWMQRASRFLAGRSGWVTLALDVGLAVPLLSGRLRGESRFWCVAAVAAAIPVTVLSAVLWEGDGGRGVLVASLWWPLLLGVPYLAARIGALAAPICAGCAVLAAAALSAGNPPGRPMLDWRDRLTACVERTGRSAGLGDDRVARRMTMASDWAMQVEPVDRSGAGLISGNNPRWFTADQTDPRRAPPYRFIVLADLEEAAIRSRYGAPTGILHCPGDTPSGVTVWLYDDPIAVGRALAAATPLRPPPGEALCLGPDALRTSGGPLPKGRLRADPKRATSQPTTWGPDADLQPGHWRVTLRYRLTSSDPGRDRWDITGAHAGISLASAALPPTGDAIGTVTAEIDLPRPIQAIEARSFIAGNGGIELLSAHFEPLDWAGTGARCGN